MEIRSPHHQRSARFSGIYGSVWERVFAPLRGVVSVSIRVEHSLILILGYGAIGAGITMLTNSY
jgi:hypothetical protein